MSITKQISRLRTTCLMPLCMSLSLWAAQQPGVWTNITPSGMKMSGNDQNGPISVNVDVVRPSDMYLNAQYDGCWKSTDFGATWRKVSVSTGTNYGQCSVAEGCGDDNGRQWYAPIDMNPHRDPATSPTLYDVRGWGDGGVWKSTDGGVHWKNTWNNNFYQADGVTKIAANLVGGDVSGVMICDSTGPNNLLAFPHGNIDESANGVYSSTDGGGKWILHKSNSFAFAPHADVSFPFNSRIWFVSHGNVIFRTTDAGSTWAQCAGTFTSSSIGRAYSIQGSTIYAGSDFTGGVLRSTDQGLTWTTLYGGTYLSAISWVVPTKTRLYVSDGWTSPHIRHASLTNPTVWTDDGQPAGMLQGGSRAAVTFDGTNYVIVAGQEKGGLWRLVEPVTTTIVSKLHPASQRAAVRLRSSRIGLESGACMVVDRAGMVYDVRGTEHASEIVFSADGRIAKMINEKILRSWRIDPRGSFGANG